MHISMHRERKRERGGIHIHAPSPVLPKLGVLHLVVLTVHTATLSKLPFKEVLESILL